MGRKIRKWGRRSGSRDLRQVSGRQKVAGRPFEGMYRNGRAPPTKKMSEPGPCTVGWKNNQGPRARLKPGRPRQVNYEKTFDRGRRAEKEGFRGSSASRRYRSGCRLPAPGPSQDRLPARVPVAVPGGVGCGGPEGGRMDSGGRRNSMAQEIGGHGRKVWSRTARSMR